MTKAEINQVYVLTTVIDSMDFDRFQVRALRVLDENANNKFAYMVYNADIHPIVHLGQVIGVTFDEYQMEHYLSESAWQYGLEALLPVTKLVVMKEKGDPEIDIRLHRSLLKCAQMVCKEPESLLTFYDYIVNLLCSRSILEWVNRYYNDYYLAEQARSIHGARVMLARTVVEHLKVNNVLSVNKRKLLAVQLKTAGLLPEYSANKEKKKKNTIIGVVVGVVCFGLACALIAVLI